MTRAIAERTGSVRLDPAQSKHGLQVVPILGISLDQPEYRLLDGGTLPAVNITEIQTTLDTAMSGNWEVFPSPGEGRDYRLSDARLTGSCLVWEEKSAVHLQLFPRQNGEADEQDSVWRPRIHRPYAGGSGPNA